MGKPGAESGGKELLTAVSGPVCLEFKRLDDDIKDKERELGVAHAEIKALRATELHKDKAIENQRSEIAKLEDKVRAAEKQLEYKNIETKKLANEKKEALAAQFAAEATLRRVHAAQKDVESLPIEAVVAPLKSEIRAYKNQIASLQDDKKASERLMKTKEAALIESEKILQSSSEVAARIEGLQNQNCDLMRQMEILKDENKVLEKSNRQKVADIQKLSQTIRELEESILVGGETANVVRDNQRQISKLNEEKRSLERELAKAKVSVDRVATVVANEWKDENDKVMPVKQWLEERRFMQGEVQRLQDKLVVSERTAKAEALLKDKFRLRLKTLGAPGDPALIAERSKRSSSQPRASFNGSHNSSLRRTNPRVGETLESGYRGTAHESLVTSHGRKEEDMVSGFLYDRLQKEVISLRKSDKEKDKLLKAKDEDIKTLSRKVEALTKAVEVEFKKMRIRESATGEKASGSATKFDHNKQKTGNLRRAGKQLEVPAN